MAHDRLMLNDIYSPDYLVIESIKNQYLPDISINTTKAPGRVGTINQGVELGERVIEVTVGIIGTNKANLDDRERELTSWLFYPEPKKLVLPHNNKYYLAQISEADIENTLIFGRGTFTFLCTDPAAYSQPLVSIPLPAADPIEIINTGNMDASPIIDITVNQDTTELEIVTEDQYMYFGRPDAVDEVTPVPRRQLILQDDCHATTDFTAGIAVDNGVIAGSLTSDGNYILQAGGDYGSGTAWHGGALVQTLGQEVQDFSLEYFVEFRMSAAAQLGRMEIYLLDINNAVIGKLAITDPTSKSMMGRAECRLGPLSGGKQLVSTEVSKGAYTNFYGRLYLQRVGQKYTFQIGKLTVPGYQYFGRYNYVWYDTTNHYQTPLAGLQIHIGAFGGSAAVPTMRINEIRVWDETTLSDDDVPYFLQAGDRLVIDSNTGQAFRNDEPVAINLGSDYIKFKPGQTHMTISPPIVESGTIEYREKWLR